MPPIPGPAASASPPRVQRVLIVDDDARVLRALADLVSATDGLAVSGLAASGRAALAADARHEPDGVLVDVLLPTLDDGLALIGTLSRRQRTVIALSVSGVGRDVALAAGATVFVEMDSDPESLLAAIRSLACVPK